MKIRPFEYKGRTIRYLVCTTVDGVEITLGWLDRFNNLHSKK